MAYVGECSATTTTVQHIINKNICLVILYIHSKCCCDGVKHTTVFLPAGIIHWIPLSFISPEKLPLHSVCINWLCKHSNAKQGVQQTINYIPRKTILVISCIADLNDLKERGFSSLHSVGEGLFLELVVSSQVECQVHQSSHHLPCHLT